MYIFTRNFWIRRNITNTSYNTYIYIISCVWEQVLIGCDGAHSVVADFLKINPKKNFAKSGTRALTYCPNGHGLPHALVRTHRGGRAFGTVPINEKFVFWFLLLNGHPPGTLLN